MHFSRPDFTISYSTQNTCILLIISMLIGPYITPLCRICLRIIGKCWGIMGGHFWEIPKRILGTFRGIIGSCLPLALRNYIHTLAINIHTLVINSRNYIHTPFGAS